MVAGDDALERAERQVAEAEKRVVRKLQLIIALEASGGERQAEAARDVLELLEQKLKLARVQLERERARVKSVC